MVGHPYVSVPDLFTEAMADGLMDLAKDVRRFRTNLADSPHHIGEALAPEADGTCSHPLFTPSPSSKLCTLAGRVDVGRHYIMTGGAEGLRETYASLASRTQSFIKFLYDLEDRPRVQALFASPKFRRVAQDVCPKARQLLDPFQTNLIINVPGQTVPAHIDAVHFWGASRFQHPQWLLAAMKFSGLFEAEFVPQVQIVGYFHKWPESDAEERAGSFLLWHRSKGAPESMVPTRGSGNAIDGSKVVHAAGVYFPGWRPPPLDPSLGKRSTRASGRAAGEPGALLIGTSSGAELRYAGEERGWELWERAPGKSQSAGDSGDHGGGGGGGTGFPENVGGERLVARYRTEDLRMSIVYRARCFADEAERARFLAQGPEDAMPLRHILDRLVDALVAKGKVSPVRAAALLADRAAEEDESAFAGRRLALALAILDGFVEYPVSLDRIIPWNGCALGVRFPALAPIVDSLCAG
jgi:hypothetical protein